MNCVFTVINKEIFSTVVIEKDKVYLLDNNDKQVLDVESKTCFNTLISLYSLKENWEKKECLNVVYSVTFDSDTYAFDSVSVPDNFYMFLGYISRLVGESM